MPYKDVGVRNAWFRTRYKKTRLFVQEYKVKQGCKDCGYNTCHAALEFDHIDNTNKTINVSKLVGSSIRAVMKEIAKCEVVCSNCHSIRTWNRRKQADLV